MFGSKKREAEAASRREKSLQDLGERIDAAKKIADPAERLDALSLIIEKIEDLTQIEVDAISKSARLKGRVVGATTTIGTYGAGAALLITGGASGLLLLAAFGAFMTGGIASDITAAKSGDKAVQKLKPYFDALDEKEIAVTAAIDKTLKDDIAAIAASPRVELLSKRGELSQKFTQALQIHVAEQERLKPPAPKNPPNNKFSL